MIKLILSQWKKKKRPGRKFERIKTFDQALALDVNLDNEISRHCLDIDNAIKDKIDLRKRFPDLGPIDFSNFADHEEIYFTVD